MDEEQLKFLFENYAKGKGFTDYGEFKGLMGDSASRRVFFDDGNKELGFKDYEDFENTLGVKKKSTPLPSQSLDGRLPSVAKEVEQPVQAEPTPVELISDPITASLKAEELRNKRIVTSSSGGGLLMGTNETSLPDEPSVKEAQRITEGLKAQGFDQQELVNDFKDFPQQLLSVEGYTPSELLELKKNNPQNYQRKIASAKWQTRLGESIRKSIVSGEVNEANGNDLLEQITISQTSEADYATKRQSTQILSQYIDDHISDEKERDKLKGYLAEDKSYAYGIEGAAGRDEALANDRRSEFLNSNQLLALNWLEDTQPGKARQYYNLLFDKKKIGDNGRAQMGYEEKASALEQIGLHLRQSAIQEDLNDITNNSIDGQFTSDQISTAERLQKSLAGLNKEASELHLKYKTPLQNETDEFIKELIGEQKGGIVYAGGKVGQEFENTASGVMNFISQPFISEESNKINQLEALGAFNQESRVFGRSQKNTALQSFVPKVSDNIKTEIDGIVNDKNLSWEDKYKKIYPLLKDNPTEWGKVPIQGGKMNISPSSMYYSIVDLGAMLAPFMALETVTGGGATAGVARKLMSTFTSAAATSFEKEYQSAIKEGVANPYMRAMTNTAISAAAMTGAGGPQMIRRMLGEKTAVGSLVSKMTDAEIESASKLRPAALKQYFTGIGKGTAGGLKEGAKFEAFMGTGELAKTKLNNEELDPETFFKQRIIGALTFGAFGAIKSSAAIKQTPIQVDALFRAANNKDQFLEAATEMRDGRQLSQADFEQVSDNIERASKVIKSTRFIDNNGKPLSTHNRNKLLMLKLKEAEVKEDMSGGVPDGYKEKKQEELKELNSEMNEVYKNKEEGNGVVTLPPQSFPKPTLIGESAEQVKPEITPIERAKEIVNTEGAVKGFTAGLLKESSKNPVEFEQHLKDISEQAADPNSRKATIETYGQELVDIAEQLNKTNDTKSTEPVTGTIQADEPKQEGQKTESGVPEGATGTGQGTTEPPASIPPVEPPKAEPSGVFSEEKRTVLSHRGLQEVATEFGLDDIEPRERKSDLRLFKDADNTISKWAEEGSYAKNMEDLVKRSESAEVLSDEQSAILAQHIANVRGEATTAKAEKGVNSPEYAAKLKELQRLTKAGEKVRSNLGAALRVPAISRRPTATLEDAMVAKMEALGVDELTDKQKGQVSEQYDVVQKERDAFEAKWKEAEAKNAELMAQNELLSANKKSTSKSKGKQDFKTERDNIRNSISEKLRKARGETNAVVIPYAKELITIAPDVARLVKSYVEEGVVELAKMIDRVHEDLKVGIPDIQKDDVRDLIAGKYNEKKPTRSDITAKMVELKTESKLLNEYERLLKGGEPNSETRKVKRNQRLAELRKEIKGLEGIDKEVQDKKDAANKINSDKAKETSNELDKIEESERKEKLAQAEKERKQFERDFEKEKRAEEKAKIKAKIQEAKELEKELSYKTPEEKQAAAAIKRNRKATEKLKERLANNDFETKPKPKSFIDNPEFKKNFPKEYKEALDSYTAKEDAQHDFEVGLLQDQMKKRSKMQVGLDFLGAGANTTKKLVTGIDDSSLFMQTLAAMASHPVIAAKAVKLHALDAVSQKRFDRNLAELHNSKDWKLMQDSGLDVTEPKSLSAEKKEEIFSGKTWDIKVKIKGKEHKVLDTLLKPFERAFTSLGNGMRVIAFRSMAEKYMQEGYTFEKDPQLFKDLALMLNTETGRGKQNEYIQKASELVTKGIWSPKLMASRLNMLGFADAASLIPGKTGTEGYYRKLHPEIRKEAIKDVIKFSTTVLALSYAAAWKFGGEVDDDPTSQTFLDIKFPDGKSYNISGGFAQYIRLMAQTVAGGRTRNGVFEEFGGKKDAGSNMMRFGRGKVTPVLGVGIDLLTGTDFAGKPITLGGEAQKLTIPLSLQSMSTELERDGLKSLYNSTLPSFVGITVKDSRDFTSHKFNEQAQEFIEKRQLKISMPKRQYSIKGEELEMDDEQYKEFLSKVDKRVEDGLLQIKNKGLIGNKNDDKSIQEAVNNVVRDANAAIKMEMFGPQFTIPEQKAMIKNYNPLPIKVKR